jgi:ribosomal protein S18 acetylase RimI-like enzyme
MRMPPPSAQAPELRLEDIDFRDTRHVSLLALLSQSNRFYYRDRKRFLNFENGSPLASPTGSTHGMLAFERSKAVGFIIYHKFDDTNPQTHKHPAIEIQFHLVDKNCRGRSIGTRLLHALESQYAMRVISVEVDVTRSAAPYYTNMGYNLNVVTHPCLGGSVTYRRKISVDGSPYHPDIKHYYKLIYSDDQACTRIQTLAEKLSALLPQLPPEARREMVDRLRKDYDRLRKSA